MKPTIIALAVALLVITVASASGTRTPTIATTRTLATLLAGDCPCLQQTLSNDTCSCSTNISSDPGYPKGGECLVDNGDCTTEVKPCLWNGVVTIVCPLRPAVVKTFSLTTCCGAEVGSIRSINCTGGTGSILLTLNCYSCPDHPQ